MWKQFRATPWCALASPISLPIYVLSNASLVVFINLTLLALGKNWTIILMATKKNPPTYCRVRNRVNTFCLRSWGFVCYGNFFFSAESSSYLLHNLLQQVAYYKIGLQWKHTIQLKDFATTTTYYVRQTTRSVHAAIAERLWPGSNYIQRDPDITYRYL